jgi:shikimate kinase/3-dehydroquinate synthase
MKYNLTQISLIGLSYSGKSTLGQIVAERLGWKFVDTDTVYTEKFGKTPAQAIKDDGEAMFRDNESVILAEVLAEDWLVVATGGGIFERSLNRRALGNTSLIVYLDVPVDTLYQRYLNDEGSEIRPLLETEQGVLHSLRELDRDRRPHYQLADLWLSTMTLHDIDHTEAVAQTATRLLNYWVQENSIAETSVERLARLEAEVAPSHPAAIVRTQDSVYPVWVGVNQIERLPDRLIQLNLTGRKLFIIADESVMEPHGRLLAEKLQAAQISGATYLIPSGESSKSSAMLEEVYAWLATHKAERTSVIIALGGGVVCDIAGYIAATYLRGLPIIMIPTSVLAMNDAAIGGKTGIDLATGKNLVGAFKQPRAVIADINTLSTLPKRSYIEGFAEIIKHGLILDSELLEWLEVHRAKLIDEVPEPALLRQITARSTYLKSLVVSADPHEQGLRAILNYGHTIGHAIETVTGYQQWMHGEAVSIGMTAAGRIARELGIMELSIFERQTDLLRDFGLPISAPGLNPDAIIEAMSRDKKVIDGKARFVFVSEVGKAIIHTDVPDSLIKDAVQRVTR